MEDVGDAKSAALPFVGARRRVMIKELPTAPGPERSYCAVRPGLRFGPAIFRDEPRQTEDTG